MQTKNTYTNLTAGEIIDALKEVPRNTEIHIEGYIFYRWKWRGEKLLALELSSLEQVRALEEQSGQILPHLPGI